MDFKRMRSERDIHNDFRTRLISNEVMDTNDQITMLMKLIQNQSEAINEIKDELKATKKHQRQPSSVDDDEMIPGSEFEDDMESKYNSTVNMHLESKPAE